MRRLVGAGRCVTDRLDGWIWSTDCGDWHDDLCFSLLDVEEMTRLGRLPGRHRQRFIRNHAVTRVLLSEQLEIPPDKLHILREPLGKPCISRNPAVHFNLSHSASFGALGISLNPVGVDIERPQGAAYDKLAKRLFPHEAAQLSDISCPVNDPLAFARLWTAKEAYLKALGKGLSKRLDSFELHVDKRGQPLKLLGDSCTADLSVCCFHVVDHPINGYVGTFVTLHHARF